MKTEGKVVLVTGATSGIGKATAELLAAKGYRVFGTSRDPAGKAGDGFELLQLDVTSDESVNACVNAVAERTDGRIDVLHNNAGTGIIGAAEEVSPEEAMRLFQVNFFGVMRVTNAVLPYMRARRAGTVINMRFKTIGGVVQRGEPVLEIVPAGDALIIDAHVSPNDISRVHPGLVAQVHLSAYSSRILPRIEGRVQSVSPDRVTDPSGQQVYYLARVEVDRERLKKQAPTVDLIPGMGAEIVIVAEERTLLEYLWQPLEAALRRGLHES